MASRKKPSSKGLSELSKGDLYERAQKANIPGRSQMSRDELITALSNGAASHSTSGKKTKASSPHSSAKERSETKRSIWSGSITFGLITIPIGLYTAIEDRDISFRLYSGKDKSRVHYKRVSTKSGREVDWDDIVKGYEYEEGKHVLFTREELEEIPPESLKVVDVVQFVDGAEIDPIYFDKSYFVAPDKTAVKAYRLFTRALTETGRVGVGKITLREKERLCTLRVKDDILMLETMNWPDEIRVPAFSQVDQATRLSAEELKMARALIDQLTSKFDREAFQDTYRQRLEEAIEAKIEGKEIELTQPELSSEKVVSLLEALKSSVEETKARRSA